MASENSLIPANLSPFLLLLFCFHSYVFVFHCMLSIIPFTLNEYEHFFKFSSPIPSCSLFCQPSSYSLLSMEPQTLKLKL